MALIDLSILVLLEEQVHRLKEENDKLRRSHEKLRESLEKTSAQLEYHIRNGCAISAPLSREVRNQKVNDLFEKFYQIRRRTLNLINSHLVSVATNCLAIFRVNSKIKDVSKTQFTSGFHLPFMT